MAHHISAILLHGQYDTDKAANFDLKSIPLEFGITMFPLDSNYCDHWAEKLDVKGLLSERPMLNCKVAHHMINAISDAPLFAVIETDYFGGVGDQAAALYQGSSELMQPTSAPVGPINEALKKLGIVARSPLDEFDTIGLGNYRNFDDLFEAYRSGA